MLNKLASGGKEPIILLLFARSSFPTREEREGELLWVLSFLSAKVSYFRGGKLSHVEDITACLVRGRFLAKEGLAQAKL